jgi:hypothetical protein
MGVETNKAAKAAIICIMVKHQSSAKWKAIARRLILCEFSG